jgi:hypothetical protein
VRLTIPDIRTVQSTLPSQRPGSLGGIHIAIERETDEGKFPRQVSALDTHTEVVATPRLPRYGVDTGGRCHPGLSGAASVREVAGRGGTNMGIGIAAATKLRPSPNAIVVLTDCYAMAISARCAGRGVSRR